METSFKGYVVYGKRNKKDHPIGVVSETNECKAKLSKIPSGLKRCIIQIEDKRFYEHKGIDFRSIARATLINTKAFKIEQGGSILTQQLARNLLKNNKRNIYRKTIEAITALNIESKYSKEEILDLYFENVYWGNNIWGLRGASIYYFGKEIAHLTVSERIILITLLRGPNLYRNNHQLLTSRYRLIINILLDSKTISPKRYYKNLKNIPHLEVNQISVIKNNTIKYIADEIDTSSYSIKTSIDNVQQLIVNKIISTSKLPISILCYENGKITAFGSTFGSNYPFETRTNVGSTLKPFLYTFLRQEGVFIKDEFDSYNNNLQWKVREATDVPSSINIVEALLYSNNNAFINACDSVGLNKCLDHLACSLNIDRRHLFPASILGATQIGITLYELVLSYYSYFFKNIDEYKIECLSLLKLNAINKLGLENAKDFFLKTGTTNDNKEKYAIMGNANKVWAVMRNEEHIKEYSKDGSFLGLIKFVIAELQRREREYRWS